MDHPTPTPQALQPAIVDALYESVYARPADLAVRHVLADQLQVIGDPRGEFISLQLMKRRQPPERRRMRAILVANRDAWMRPLQPVALGDAVKFEAGFPTRLALRSARRTDPTDATDLACMGRPEWRTLHTLSVAGAAANASHLLLHDVCPLLTRVIRVNQPQLLDAVDRPLRLEYLDCSLACADRENADRFRRLGPFLAALNELRMDTLNVDYPVWEWFPGLRTLDCFPRDAELARWVRLHTDLERIHLRGVGVNMTLVGAGQQRRIQVHRLPPSRAGNQRWLRVVDTLSTCADVIGHVDIVHNGKQRAAHEAWRMRLSKALDCPVTLSRQ
jgi:uncharacterized protein (TIGR02996 family)